MKFRQWFEKKRAMFAPEELSALRINHPGVVAQARRVWEDDVADKPRRRAIIVVGADQKSSCDRIYKQLDVISNNNIFNVGLSPTGSEPITHYWINWNMSASEWDWIEPRFRAAKRWLYDGRKITPNEVLKTMGLKVIQAELPYAKQ